VNTARLFETLRETKVLEISNFGVQTQFRGGLKGMLGSGRAFPQRNVFARTIESPAIGYF
jgi:hypothetical protein